MATAAARRFLDPTAPNLDKDKRRIAIVKLAIEKTLQSETAEPRHKAQLRSFLRQLNDLLRERPGTTRAGLMAMTGGLVSLWAYEPELAPAGNMVHALVKSSVALDRASRELRSLSSIPSV